MSTTSLPPTWHDAEPAAPLRWLAVWPVTDPAMTARQLVAEAADDLPDVARRHRYRVVAVERWVRCPGRLVPGSGGAHEVIVAACWVQPIPRPADPDWGASGPSTTALAGDVYADMAGEPGCTWPQLEQRTGRSRQTLRRGLRRVGHDDMCARLDRATDGPDYVVPSHRKAAA